jgi:hypothetical protein
MTDSPSAIPDGLNGRAYEYTERLSRPEWAWEFLRRNPEFRRQMERFSAHVISGRVAPNAMIGRLEKNAPSLIHWGLRFRCFGGSPDE